MTDVTEAEFDALWERIKGKHNAKYGEGDAERLAEEGRRKFGAALGFPDNTKGEQNDG